MRTLWFLVKVTTLGFSVITIGALLIFEVLSMANKFLEVL